MALAVPKGMKGLAATAAAAAAAAADAAAAAAAAVAAKGLAAWYHLGTSRALQQIRSRSLIHLDVFARLRHLPYRNT